MSSIVGVALVIATFFGIVLGSILRNTEIFVIDGVAGTAHLNTHGVFRIFLTLALISATFGHALYVAQCDASPYGGTKKAIISLCIGLTVLSLVFGAVELIHTYAPFDLVWSCTMPITSLIGAILYLASEQLARKGRGLGAKAKTEKSRDLFWFALSRGCLVMLFCRFIFSSCCLVILDMVRACVFFIVPF